MDGGSRVRHPYAHVVHRSWWGRAGHGFNPWMARYWYSLIFLIIVFFTWIMRDYGHPLLIQLHNIQFVRKSGVADPHGIPTVDNLFRPYRFGAFRDCRGNKDCLGAEGVLRVCLAPSIFYLVMMLLTLRISELHEPRERLQSAYWKYKILFLVFLMAVSFFLPSTVIQFYGIAAVYGAGVYLILQVVSTIMFISTARNWCQRVVADRCHINMTILASPVYAAALGWVIYMFTVYTSCWLNTFFITMTVVLVLIINGVSHWVVKSGCFTPGIFTFYVMYLLFSIMSSEPPGDKCLKNSRSFEKWMEILIFVASNLILVYNTFSTGIDYEIFQRRTVERDEVDVPYTYWFFHFVFTTGTMYTAMLFIGWRSDHSTTRWAFEGTWTSAWVRFATQWVTVGFYVWWILQRRGLVDEEPGRSSSSSLSREEVELQELPLIEDVPLQDLPALEDVPLEEGGQSEITLLTEELEITGETA